MKRTMELANQPQGVARISLEYDAAKDAAILLKLENGDGQALDVLLSEKQAARLAVMFNDASIGW